MFKKNFYILIFILFATSLTASQKDSSVVVLAAANNKFVLPTFLESFSEKYPDIKVRVVYGTSGDLAESIIDGESYDVFLSANLAYAQKVYDAKKALSLPKEYARGSLILIVPADKSLHQKKLTILKSKKIQSVGIVNKESSPYGIASLEVLQNAKLLDELKTKIKYSSNLSTIMTNVIWYDDAVFLSKSAIHSLPKAYKQEGKNWIEVDESLYSPIIQTYVISQKASTNQNVSKFLDFLHSDEGRAIYIKFGYK